MLFVLRSNAGHARVAVPQIAGGVCRFETFKRLMLPVVAMKAASSANMNTTRFVNFKCKLHPHRWPNPAR